MARQNPMAQKAARGLRPLGYNERYQLALYQLRYYVGTTVTCRYRVPAGRFSSDEDLRAFFAGSVADVVTRHPMMQVGLLGHESKKPAWVPLQRIDMARHISWAEEDAEDGYEGALAKALLEQLDGEFSRSESQPGWRILVLRAKEGPQWLDVVFCWEHSFFDGKSAKIFHQDLLDALRLPQQQTARDRLDGLVLQLPATFDSLTPPTESLSKFSTTARFKAKVVSEELLPACLSPRNPSQATWCPIRESPSRTARREFRVASASLERILAACRRHETTLTGLLHGLALVSASRRLDATQAVAFAAGSAVDLRRFLPSQPAAHPALQPERTMANYVTSFTHRFGQDAVAAIRTLSAADPGPGPDSPDSPSLSAEALDLVWPVASGVRKELLSKLDLGLKNDVLGLAKYVGDFRGALRDKARKPRSMAWVVTNIGGFRDAGGGPGPGPGDGDGAGTWQLESAQFDLSAEVEGPVFCLGVVSAPSGGLSVSCTWQEGIVPGELAHGFAEDLRAWMGQIGRAE